MKTFLIFFGKSQSFTFNAYTEESIIQKFDSIIQDFELLESKWFTVDKADNLPILAKYYFKYANTMYSLLKLYSYGQAAFGDRIEGSIYGVGLLSENNLSLSKINIDILFECKKVFADQCLLNGLKFKKIDFENETTEIWKAFNHNNGFQKINYFEKYPDSIDNRPIGIHIKDYLNLYDVGRRLDYSYVYFTQDLGHLKRATQSTRGIFEIYQQINNKIIPIKKSDTDLPKISRMPNTHISELLELQNSIMSQKEKINRLENENEILVKLLKKSKLKSIILLSLILILLGITLYLLVFDNKFLFQSRVQQEAPHKSIEAIIINSEKTSAELKSLLDKIDNTSNDIENLRNTIKKVDSLLLIQNGQIDYDK